MSVALNSKSSPVMSEKDDSKDVVVGSSPVTDTAPVAKAVVVSADRIMTDYELNEEKADDVYKDRRLCIKGKIGKISVLGDEPFVEMSADSYGLRNVKFTLDKGRVNVLDSLQVGDIKVIEGTVVGYTLFKVSVTDPVLITQLYDKEKREPKALFLSICILKEKISYLSLIITLRSQHITSKWLLIMRRHCSTQSTLVDLHLRLPECSRSLKLS